MKKSWAVLGLLVLALFSACGGGGGAGGASPPPSVPDTTVPVITLSGTNPQTVEAGTPYVELGATALDNVDGNIPAVSIVITGTVDTNTVGAYTKYYNVSDSSGNPATQVTRTVNVVDTTGPVITVSGLNPDSVLVGSGPYVDMGATAVDAVDGVRPVVVTGSVNTSVVGSNTLTYAASDLSLHTTSVTRTVNVIPVPDTTPPVITLVGVDPQTVYVGDAFVDLGATALDNVDGNITANIAAVCNVNTAVVGAYSCTYNVSDSSDNPATQVTRTVNVVAVPVLATGKIFYPGYDAAEKLLHGGDGAIYSQDLSTTTMTRLWGGYLLMSDGWGVRYPYTIVPARNGGKIVFQGSNLMGFHILDVTVSPSVQTSVTPGPSLYDGECSRVAEGSFDVTSDGGTAVFSSRCFPGGTGSGIPERRNIILMKLDGSLSAVRVTDDTITELSPAICGEDATTISVCFLSNSSGSYDIWKQVVDKATGALVGAQTLVVSGAVDGVRAMSWSPDFSQFVFMRTVAGETHVIVKAVAGGAEVDLGLGRDPYWSTNGNNLIMYTASCGTLACVGLPGVRYAIHPDGTGKVVVPTPTNIAANNFIGAAACGDMCLGNIVFPAAGY